MPADLSPISLAQFFYQSGQIVRPARLYFYKPGTEDRVVVYTDPGLSVPYDQPVLTGGSGRVPPIYIGPEPYRVRIWDSLGALIEDIDYLPGSSSGGSGDENSTLTDKEKLQLLQTGDFVVQFSNGETRPGFVRANAGLIGPPGFSGTGFPNIERLSDDCYDLFVRLWSHGAGTIEVIPARGSDADSDWFSNAKVLKLPDLRGRSLAGLDAMGMPAAGRLAGVPITPSGGENLPGSYGGVAAVTMTASQMPPHTHTIESSLSNVVVAAAYAGISVTQNATASNYAAYTGVYPAAAYANISIAAAYANVSIYDPGHSHSFDGLWLAPGGYIPGGGPLQFQSMATNPATTGISISDGTHVHGVNDGTHSHTMVDPTHTHAQYPHAHYITDPTHTHPVTDYGHTHTISTVGGDGGSVTPVPVMSPFLLATVYIKL